MSSLGSGVSPHERTKRRLRLVAFCEPPPFDTEGLHDEEFLFLVCSGRFEFRSCQLLPCDVIIMTVGRANCDHARCCADQRLRQPPPLLIVMADEPTAVPESLRPDAVVPQRATASKVIAVLRSLPWRP